MAASVFGHPEPCIGPKERELTGEKARTPSSSGGAASFSRQQNERSHVRPNDPAIDVVQYELSLISMFSGKRRYALFSMTAHGGATATSVRRSRASRSDGYNDGCRRFTLPPQHRSHIGGMRTKPLRHELAR